MKKVYRSGKAVDIKTTSSKDKSLVVQVNKEIIHFQDIAKRARAEVDKSVKENLWDYVEEEVLRIKEENIHHPHEQLLEMYATTKVLLDAYLRDLYVQGAKIDALMASYLGNVDSRVSAGKNRGVRTNLLYVQRKELALRVIQEMESRHGKLQSSNSKEFYRLLDEACVEKGIQKTPHESARNYFKEITGLSSTR
ncbi:hypothetical protein G6699_01615 [Polynucleobacter paneuropaeus]|jgi:hypothetical protein|nr:hypothetical protein [Polynucleobacter paneuropaeus]